MAKSEIYYVRKLFEVIMSYHSRRLLCASALLLLSQLAHAQYSWIDAKGTRVFSDRAPPAGTPPGRILATPRGARALMAEPGNAAEKPADKPVDAPAGMPADKKAPSGLAEREADYRKRTAEREQAERKTADEAKKKQALAEQCAAVRSSERTLASGIRITEVDANGQRTFVSDDERARRLAAARSALAACN
jgi:hypothetical protein